MLPLKRALSCHIGVLAENCQPCIEPSFGSRLCAGWQFPWGPVQGQRTRVAGQRPAVCSLYIISHHKHDCRHHSHIQFCLTLLFHSVASQTPDLLAALSYRRQERGSRTSTVTYSGCSLVADCIGDAIRLVSQAGSKEAEGEMQCPAQPWPDLRRLVPRHQCVQMSSEWMSKGAPQPSDQEGLSPLPVHGPDSSRFLVREQQNSVHGEPLAI